MGLTRSQQDAALAEIYAQIPVLPDCDGRCWVSCGPIEMFDRERARIRASGVRISDAETAMRSLDTFYCEALRDGRCTVYEIRPLICRIWGAVEDMPCPFGCVPEPRYLTTQEAMVLMAQAHQVAGLAGHALSAADVGKIEDRATMDLMTRAARAGWTSGRHGIELRVADQVPAGLRKAGPVVTRTQQELTAEVVSETQDPGELRRAIDDLNRASREASQIQGRRR